MAILRKALVFQENFCSLKKEVHNLINYAIKAISSEAGYHEEHDGTFYNHIRKMMAELWAILYLGVAKITE